MGMIGVRELTSKELSGLTDADRENIVLGWNGQQEVYWSISCNRNHCTPEERAVIDAAVNLCAPVAVEFSQISELKLLAAVKQMLATKAENDAEREIST